MKFRRYLALMASSWLLAAVVVVSFTLLVDAIGISPVQVSVAGFNTSKPLRQDFDWIVKRYEVLRNEPATIFMGSSRIKQSIDPALLANTGYAPAYNGGINGSASFQEIRSYLQYYLGADKNLQHVFIEAFAIALFSYDKTKHPEVRPPQGAAAPQMRPPEVHFGRLADIGDLASVFFSMSGLNSAVRTISVNREQQNSPTASQSDGGFAPIPLAPHHFSVRNSLNFVIHTGLIQRGGEVAPSIFATARQMIAKCQWYQVECRFFVSPLHADVLYAMYYLGWWPELEKLKRGLAALAPTYDFTRYSHLIDERSGPVVYWPETFHFSPALGELIARAMTGLRTPDMPENFGALLEPNNIDSSLAAWRQERDNWIAQHPDVVERMRKAEENFHKGVSFKSVTDAEIAAGGW